jgi:hypothetical protein
LGYYKPLFACVDRTFGNQFIAPARAIFLACVAAGPLMGVNVYVLLRDWCDSRAEKEEHDAMRMQEAEI